MLGYLNSPSPFTEDGWFQTGDEVRIDGEWLHILGRRSEIINVGGERISDYKLYKKYKKDIRKCKRNEIQNKINFKISKDASLNCNILKKIMKK